MSLFADTISDARRPLAGWLRRAATDSAESAESAAPEDEAADVDTPPGINTIFRFQKEGSLRSREAPFQQGSGGIRQPAGVPLSAGGEVERPEPSAPHVGNNGMSVKGDNRGNILGTGQKERIGPSKVEAASAVSVSIPVQSVVSSAPFEAELSRVKSESETPDGSEPTVSESGETFESRPTGRGAPSEPSASPTPPAWPAAGAGPLPQPASGTGGGSPPAQTEDPRPPDQATPRRGAAFAATGLDTSGSAAVTVGVTAAPALPHGAAPRSALTTAPASAASPMDADLAAAGAPPAAMTARQRPFGRDEATAAERRPVGAPRATPAAAASAVEPTLVIGRIDVVVLAHDAPPAHDAPQRVAAETRGFIARNYLKRL